MNPRANTGDMPPAGQDISPANAEACESFALAQRALYARDFALASDLSAQYRRQIRYDDFWRQDKRNAVNPVLSVVIVAYATNMHLILCIKSVLRCARKDVEIIVVDNGGNEEVLPLLLQMPLLYIRPPMNMLLSEGRNIGVYHAGAPLCAFLDDDAIAAPGYVENALSAFSVPGISAVRGKVVPKTRTAFRGSEGHYDPGPKPLAHVINTEGNSVWRADAYQDANGMDPLLFGHEGTDLSIRLQRMYGNTATFYWPALVIHHDFAANETKHEVKNSRHALMGEYLEWKHARMDPPAGAEPVLSAFADKYARTWRKTSAAPLVSVVLPACNAESFLAECLQSLLGQSMRDFEILLVDDCSTDATVSVAQSFSDERIRCCKKTGERGIVGSLNLGLSLARGKYIARMDADDVCREYRFAAQLRLMEDNPCVCVCGGSCFRFGEASGHMDYPVSDPELKSGILFRGPFPHPFVMLRADFFKRNAIEYDAAYQGIAEDYELWLRLARGRPDCLFANLPYILGGYRKHGASITAANKAVVADGVASILRPHLEELCGEVSDGEAKAHSALFRNEFLVDSPEEWLGIKQWLIRLKAANERKSVYDPMIFNKNIAWKLHELCLANLWLGPWVVKQFASYEGAEAFGFSGERVGELSAMAEKAARQAQRR